MLFKIRFPGEWEMIIFRSGIYHENFKSLKGIHSILLIQGVTERNNKTKEQNSGLSGMLWSTLGDKLSDDVVFELLIDKSATCVVDWLL